MSSFIFQFHPWIDIVKGDEGSNDDTEEADHSELENLVQQWQTEDSENNSDHDQKNNRDPEKENESSLELQEMEVQEKEVFLQK